MKKLILCAFIATTALSCKKEDMSKYATKEDLENVASDSKAKIHHFTLNFGPGTTYQFSPFIYKDSPNDIMLIFTEWDEIGGESTWVQCPFTYGNVAVIAETMEHSIIINVLRADGLSGSPLTQEMAFKFKAVIIPASGIEANPNVDLTNYQEVKQVFL